jgi:hypothetical protein
MIIRLIIILLSGAMLCYYVLVLLEAFRIVRWTGEKGNYQWIPFYYLLKKKKK